MAKLTARGATVLRKWRCSTGLNTYLVAYRSDGRLLRRLTGDYGTGYTLLPGKVTRTPDEIETYLRTLYLLVEEVR